MSDQSRFWLDDKPLALASSSAARRSLLESAGIPIDIIRAPVDETAIAASLLGERATPRQIAVALAHSKAEAAARRLADRVILAGDQTLDHAGTLLMKPVDRTQARRHLERLRASSHMLHSAAVLRRGDQVLWAGVASATLVMRPFGAAFLDTYLERLGDVVSETVGGYQVEAMGIQLFEAIEGDHATILGLPLLPVLHALRDLGMLAR